MDCSVYVAKKALISCAITVQLICAFVFAYAKSRFLMARLILWIILVTNLSMKTSQTFCFFLALTFITKIPPLFHASDRISCTPTIFCFFHKCCKLLKLSQIASFFLFNGETGTTSASTSLNMLNNLSHRNIL